MLPNIISNAGATVTKNSTGVADVLEVPRCLSINNALLRGRESKIVSSMCDREHSLELTYHSIPVRVQLKIGASRPRPQGAFPCFQFQFHNV